MHVFMAYYQTMPATNELWPNKNHANKIISQKFVTPFRLLQHFGVVRNLFFASNGNVIFILFLFYFSLSIYTYVCVYTVIKRMYAFNGVIVRTKAILCAIPCGPQSVSLK